MTPEPDEDFVDPADEYKMPWEEDKPLPEVGRSKAGDWPLPNISHMMIERIGALKPKKFAKFDMTKGYWQLGLAPAVRQATAFITWMGIFVWNRILMGLQPAASYFQYCMLMIVLAGLAYVICEGYIDDIIVHEQDYSDLLVNLRQVLSTIPHRIQSQEK